MAISALGALWIGDAIASATAATPRDDEEAEDEAREPHASCRSTGAARPSSAQVMPAGCRAEARNPSWLDGPRHGELVMPERAAGGAGSAGSTDHATASW